MIAEFASTHFAAKAAGPGAAMYVAPLVFAGAPIINTIASLTGFNHGKTESPSPPFFLGLVLAAAGAAMVMLYKPGPAKAAAPAEQVQSAPVDSAD